MAVASTPRRRTRESGIAIERKAKAIEDLATSQREIRPMRMLLEMKTRHHAKRKMMPRTAGEKARRQRAESAT